MYLCIQKARKEKIQEQWTADEDRQAGGEHSKTASRA